MVRGRQCAVPFFPSLIIRLIATNTTRPVTKLLCPWKPHILGTIATQSATLLRCSIIGLNAVEAVSFSLYCFILHFRKTKPTPHLEEKEYGLINITTSVRYCARHGTAVGVLPPYFT